MKEIFALFLDQTTFKYLIVGIIGAIIELSVFSLMIRYGIGLVISNILAFHLAFLACYFLHYEYTHGRPFEGIFELSNGLIKYATLMYSQLVVGTALLWILIEELSIGPDLSKLLQLALITPISYLIQRKFIFRRV
ncbi:MAG: GtrA family protein [Pseudomonadales bacterium]|nr:GtrA family protein [Pseudomonadales bacterium]